MAMYTYFVCCLIDMVVVDMVVLLLFRVFLCSRRSIVVTDMFSRLSTLEQGMALARMNADKGELALNISRFRRIFLSPNLLSDMQ